MLQFIMEKNILIYALAAACVVGVVSRMVLRRIYDGLLKDTANSGEPEGRFLQQLRQRFQYCTHLNEQVGDVRALIQRSLMEYRVWGISLHGWQRFGNGCLTVSLLCAAVGTAVRVQNQAAVIAGNSYFWMGAGALVLSAFAWALADISYRSRSLEICLCDYLENSGAVRVYSEEELPDLEYESVNAQTPIRTPIVSVEEGRRAKQRAKAETAAGSARGQAGKSGKMALSRGRKEADAGGSARAQRDKNELKESLARMKAGMQESAAADADRPGGDRSGDDRGARLLREMDPKEQERLVREVLNEFLSQ
ncbi:MAG: hypothetical protein LUI14_16165 [Lachnospiraceae bacterium]|nr:hypothetical protein [Lachnospiraceae bacterium]